MTIPNQDIGSAIAPKVGNVPLNNAAGTRNGSSIDRMGFQSCVLVVEGGASEGTPTSLTLDAKLQDSTDGSTGWADIAGAAITQITAVNTQGLKNVNLSNAKRYIRVVEVVAFVGGTAPKLNAAEIVILGGVDTLPTT